MSTKLTLSIDEKVVAEAKEYAKEAGKSVSQIVESYLRVLTQKNNKHTPSLPAHISRWQGAFKSTGKKIIRKCIQQHSLKNMVRNECFHRYQYID